MLETVKENGVMSPKEQTRVKPEMNEAEFLGSKKVKVMFEDINIPLFDQKQGELPVNGNEISRNFEQFNISKRKKFTGSYSKLSGS